MNDALKGSLGVCVCSGSDSHTLGSCVVPAPCSIRRVITLMIGFVGMLPLGPDAFSSLWGV